MVRLGIGPLSSALGMDLNLNCANKLQRDPEKLKSYNGRQISNSPEDKGGVNIELSPLTEIQSRSPEAEEP